MIPQGCNQGTDSILMSQAAEDTADYYEGAARAGCSRKQGEPAAEDDDKAGKDGDTIAKLSLHSSLACARWARQVCCRHLGSAGSTAPHKSVAERHQHHRGTAWPGQGTSSPAKHRSKARGVRPRFSWLFLTKLFPQSCLTWGHTAAPKSRPRPRPPNPWGSEGRRSCTHGLKTFGFWKLQKDLISIMLVDTENRTKANVSCPSVFMQLRKSNFIQPEGAGNFRYFVVLVTKRWQ